MQVLKPLLSNESFAQIFKDTFHAQFVKAFDLGKDGVEHRRDLEALLINNSIALQNTAIEIGAESLPVEAMEDLKKLDALAETSAVYFRAGTKIHASFLSAFKHVIEEGLSKAKLRTVPNNGVQH